jgi:predicted RNase H-like HicB family nuclease
MTGKISVVIEQDQHGCYAWCPELRGCQSQGETVEETLANIREAIELFLETLTDEERSAALSQEILTTSIEVHAYGAALNRGGCRSDALESRLLLVAVQG